MYHVEAFIAQEAWVQQGGTYDSPAPAAEAALAISRERQISTRVREEALGWTRFECLPGGIQLRQAYDRAMPEIHQAVGDWLDSRHSLEPVGADDIDVLVEAILRRITQELQEHA